MEQQQPIRLVFKEAEIIDISAYPGQDSPTQVLKIRALLTRPLAGQLGCEDLCFAENGIPRNFGSIKLDSKGRAIVIKNAEIVLPGGATWPANKVYDFKVQRPKDATPTDPSLEILCSLHFDAHVPIWQFLLDQNCATFEATVKPPTDWNPQMNLFGKADDDEGDEAGEENESEQEDSEPRLISAAQAEDTKQADQDVVGHRPLIDHQKGARRRARRNPDAESIADGTAPIDVEAEVIN